LIGLDSTSIKKAQRRLFKRKKKKWKQEDF
jgi:hypothetical protein